MIFPQYYIHKQRILFLTMLCLASMIVMGCGLKKVHQQIQVLDNIGTIKGSINIDSNQQGPVVVLRFRDINGILVRENEITASETGYFSFSTTAGSYYIAAFIDVNKDGSYQQGEHLSVYGLPSKINLAFQQTITLEPIVISKEWSHTETEVKPIDGVLPIWKNIGKVVTIDDPVFSQANYTMGLWWPLDFLNSAEGGLFFLEKYQDDKVPVIFVHGAMGGPTNFKTMIERLDSHNFQSWVVFYPSGVRLDLISDYLVEAVTQLQNKYGFSEFIVIAHSMGGLITRSFVKKYVSHSQENLKRIGFIMTVNSPMDGIPSASSGVKYSPVVVPSWRDVEPGSAFLKDIHVWKWPQEIPYYLVFSYADRQNGDGVVPLSSQVPLNLQTEAKQVYGFNNDHVGTLSDEEFLVLFNRILKGY